MGDASFSYWFGTVRFIHFVAAFVFFFNFLFRIYWGFVGNEFARWSNFIPHRKAQLREAMDVLKVDILQAKAEPLPSIGHNSVAGFTYFLTFLAFVFQCFTGFGMYAAMSKSWLPRLFAWIVPLMGGTSRRASGIT
jgi:Ni/Fe-hydrogenase 1 B-type cytochrome subunit